MIAKSGNRMKKSKAVHKTIKTIQKTIQAKRKKSGEKTQTALYICEKCGALNKSPGIHEYDKGRYIPKMTESLKSKQYFVWGYKGFFGTALILLSYYNFRTSILTGSILLAIGLLVLIFLGADIKRRSVLF